MIDGNHSSLNSQLTLPPFSQQSLSVGQTFAWLMVDNRYDEGDLIGEEETVPKRVNKKVGQCSVLREIAPSLGPPIADSLCPTC